MRPTKNMLALIAEIATQADMKLLLESVCLSQDAELKTSKINNEFTRGEVLRIYKSAKTLSQEAKTGALIEFHEDMNKTVLAALKKSLFHN